MFENADIYVPCALGGDINDESINHIKARIIAGAANNQLSRPDHAAMLHKKGILYAPDYAINAGGVINVVMIGLSHDQMMQKVAAIGDTLDEIFKRSKAQDMDTASIADQIVQERLNTVIAGKQAVNA